MKLTTTAAAFLAVGATAQNSTSTKTVYYNTCSTSTDLSTVTYCPPCEAAGMTTFAGGSFTTYKTIYTQVCPTDAARLEEATYTVTEPCPSTGLSRGASYIPQGFTVTTVSCSACEAGKSQYVQTAPVPALASALAAPAAAPAAPTPAPGAPAAPAGAASPAGTASPAGVASPANAENAAVAPGAASPAGNGAAAPGGAASPPGAASPAENGAAAPGSPAGAPAPYPLPTQAGQVAAASGAPASNSNSTVPFTGAANMVSVDISSFMIALATLFTGFAFLL